MLYTDEINLNYEIISVIVKKGINSLIKLTFHFLNKYWLTVNKHTCPLWKWDISIFLPKNSESENKVLL